MSDFRDILLYTGPQGEVRIEVILQDETLWLYKRIAELFGVETHSVNYHLKEIFKTGELCEEATGATTLEVDFRYENLTAGIAYQRARRLGELRAK